MMFKKNLESTVFHVKCGGVTYSHRWVVPWYLLGTGAGTVGTFVVPIPVPQYFAIFWRYRYFSFVLFFSTDFKKVIKNLKRCKNACE